ncbi:MarR family transcriptional regulator [Desulfitobacterium hafniense]|uniref:MarR family transcriptional regulator n=1 Tax=Desulfitobacterium hafniense TaxID=49338 RepID=A0A0W1JCT7_DESHA|nr:MarR family winged helix-turn-helix transcriptional regulator [Desulfitobacterium hafniense]KTE89497.1 MarR family transcriptional regulator [Desulfitobacterium hafniense]
MKQQINPKRPSPCHCINTRRASRAVTQFYDDILKPSGITTSQLSLLKHLEIAETATISELAKRMRIDRTTLNRNMKPLIEAEFLEIKQGKDSRTRQIMLTGKGKDAVDRGWKLWGVAQASLKEYMGEEDLAKLVELLSKLEALAP